MVKRKDGKLTIKESKFVTAKIQGKTNLQAYQEAGYSTKSTKETQMTASSNVNTRPTVQKALDDALTKHGATPEWAVMQLIKVAEQDDEIGAKRLASKDIIELHGWSKSERPNMHVEFKGNFFTNSRSANPREDIIDAETT